ncbi:hypothetical protein JMA_27060 [Jeotgalibacillus malaysiensis]|uniref:SGNH hydrolase-type esterase domain-containing protein n=1 Tax=Jeotgalibacillus malaysiensis TaxID=1508404 RepID=A0A0B5ATX2_9BACL|nr:SGNH/GDSL hydrolase family protein [Jeotgalibacillus malaysiensis]AJD92023.1 hypothetical protein JMA_27060 [Jeotgalibacillus malaysiensis]
MAFNQIGPNMDLENLQKLNENFDKAETSANQTRAELDSIVMSADPTISDQLKVGAGGIDYGSPQQRLLQERQQLTDQLADIASESVVISKADLTPIVLKNGSKVISTGDSLSFNRHPFEAGTIGGNNGYEYQVGMLSWSFMVRDAIHRMDEYFKNITEIPIRSKNLDANFFYYPLSAPYRNAAFNGIMLMLQTKNVNEEFSFRFRHNNPNNKAIIYSSYNVLNVASAFDIHVDGVFQKNVNTYGVGKDHQGYDIFAIEIDLLGDNQHHDIKISNITQTHPTPSSDGMKYIYLYGIGTKFTTFKMTGQGGTTSQWLLDNVQTRILDHNADVVFITTGANDITNGLSAEQTYQNVSSIVSAIKSNKPSSQIILLSTTKRSTYSVEQTMPYVNAIKKVAQEQGCGFVDLVNLLINVENSLIDGVHMSIIGNDILAKTILKEFFNGANYQKDLVSGNEAYFRDKTKYDFPKQIKGWARISYSGSNYVIDSQSSEGWIESVTKSGTDKVLVKFKVNAVMTMKGIVRSGFVYGFNAQKYFTTTTPPALAYTVELAGWSLDTVTFFLRKTDGTAITETDYTNEPAAFKFMITY